MAIHLDGSWAASLATLMGRWSMPGNVSSGRCCGSHGLSLPVTLIIIGLNGVVCATRGRHVCFEHSVTCECKADQLAPMVNLL